MRPVYFDTNVFVYQNSTDSARQRRARAASKRETARSAAVTSFLALNEYVWVTQRLADRTTALEGAGRILEAPGLRVLPIGLEETRLALDLMTTFGLRPHDAGHAAVALHHGCRGILSFDADFDKVPGLKRIRP